MRHCLAVDAVFSNKEWPSFRVTFLTKPSDVDKSALIHMYL